MKKQLTEEVNFSFIRYANCWEDAEVLLQGLQMSDGANVISVASAGDNSFSFLVHNNVSVHAVDVNQTQLHLCALKKAGIEHFSHAEFLNFLGFTDCNHRIDLFNRLKPHLAANVLVWANTMMPQIEAGIIHHGKFEHYFAKFRKYILPLIHQQHTIQQLLAPKLPQEQMMFYNNFFNTWRWRFLFKLFFSKFVMGRLGRDPKFLEQVDIEVGPFIYQQAQNQLMSVACQSNGFLHYIFTGKWHPNHLPHYAKPENFAIIKQNIQNITFGLGYAQNVVQQQPQFYTHANLSNIFEYLDMPTFLQVGEALQKHMAPKAKCAYWNLMVKRLLEKELPFGFAQCKHVYTKLDNGFFYRSFQVSQKRH
jgi:S-adenosylmethionine-diacylglycerol 3-amino-3-carboxypropyl transferase